ncbi:chaplin [Streptomyces sp. H39-S7]|uniref:chaplin n=1 Tax=Streptomyces sp. H39-S7 TaxID=3004357 RepID=UPI003FA7DE33
MSRFAKATTVVAVMGSALFAGAGMAAADAGAQAAAIGSPGVLSGNVLQVPVHIPINLCGNSVNVIGLLNPAFGNTCVNGSGHDKSGDDGRNNDHGRPHGSHGPQAGQETHGQHSEHGQQTGHQSHNQHGDKDDCEH